MSANTIRPEKALNYTVYAVVLILVLLALRLVSLWFNNSELYFDEAQYWFWGQDLAFGYFSKPPVLGWLIAATTGLCGSDSAFCVRLSAPFFHAGTALLVFLCARRLFDAQTGFWAATLYALMPAVSLSSTIISTDVPLLFFWSLALYAYLRLGENHRWSWGVVLGLALGFGLNAKYAMLYFLLCSLLHMLVEQGRMTPPRKAPFWLGVLIGLALLIPNAIWNFQNSFATVTHTGENIGWEGLNLNWIGTLEFLGSQFGVFGPILFGIYLATLFAMFRERFSHEMRLLVLFSLPILAIIVFQALMSKAYANWAATAYIAATILVAHILVSRVPWHWMRSTLVLHGFVFAIVSLAVCFAAPGQIVLPNGFQPFERTQGSKEMAKAVSNRLETRDYDGVLTVSRKMSALMTYNLRERSEPVYAWRTSAAPRDHYQLVSAFQGNGDKVLLVVSKANYGKDLESQFANVEYLGAEPIESGEIDLLHFHRASGYSTKGAE